MFIFDPLNMNKDSCISFYTLKNKQKLISEKNMKLKVKETKKWYFVTKIVLTYCEKKLS